MQHGSSLEMETLCDSVHRAMRQILTQDYLQHIDRDGVYPEQAYQAWIALGLTGLGVPAEYGGSGGSIADLASVSEALAYWSYDVSTAYTVPMFCAQTLLVCGTEAQKQAFLPKLVQGTLRMSVCISEAEAGSDVSAIATRAIRQNDEWVLDGQKLWATGAGAPDNLILVYARTADGVPAKQGLSVFMVENSRPGVTCRKLDMLGRRATGSFEVTFDQVRLPTERLLGALHGGWDCLLAGLEAERVLTSAGYVGSSQRVVDLACEHARDRRQFGRPIGTNQAISHMLADMQTDVEAARLLARQAAQRVADGYDSLREVSMAKLFGSEAYVRVANQGMQVMGAMGYSMAHEMQRHFRDSRSTTIGAGSSQMQRNTIAATMGLSSRV